MTDPNPRLPRLFSNSCNIPYFSGCALTAKEKFVLVHLMPVLMPQALNSCSRDTERTGDNSTDQPRLPPPLGPPSHACILLLVQARPSLQDPFFIRLGRFLGLYRPPRLSFRATAYPLRCLETRQSASSFQSVQIPTHSPYPLRLSEDFGIWLWCYCHSSDILAVPSGLIIPSLS
jgi:hypothetical protein